MKIKNIRKIDRDLALKNYGVSRKIRRAREKTGSYENVVIATDMDVD
jgi:hypothetical protein